MEDQETLLVVGSAPCLFEDVERALEIYDGAHIMLVNGACVSLKEAQHVLAGHTNKAEEFASARRSVFPDADPWCLHANWNNPETLADAKKEYPSVTDWWGKGFSTGATSIAKGARIGLAMGYAPIIICGAPMDGSGYFVGESESGKKIKHDCLRIGDSTKQDAYVIQKYRYRFTLLAENDFKGKVFSMSGFTRSCLGGPQDFLNL